MERKLYEYDYEKPELTDEFFEHHGIKGQKWGVRNGPPYPLNESRGGMIGGSSKGHISKRKKRKLQKQRVKTLKKARQIRTQKLQEQKETAKTKEEIIKSRDAVSMMKNIDKFTTQEIQEFNNRENAIRILNQRVTEIKESQMTKGQKLKRFAKKTASKAAEDIAVKVIRTTADMAFKKLAESTNNKVLAKAADAKTKDQVKNLEKQLKQKTKNGSQDIRNGAILDLIKNTSSDKKSLNNLEKNMDKFSNSTKSLDDYTQELLKKNARKLANY